MKPLDIVETKHGSIAVVTEVSERGEASITFIGERKNSFEKNAWYGKNEGLKVVDSLPNLLGRTMCHPFGNGARLIENYYPVDKTVVHKIS